MPERLKDAVAEHHILLREDPYRVDSYRQLYKLYFDAREYDSAWCVAAALSFLKKADTEHAQFYEQYKPEGPIRPKSRLTNERWVKDLFHPEEDYVVGKLFEAVTPALLRMKAQPDKTWAAAQEGPDSGSDEHDGRVRAHVRVRDAGAEPAAHAAAVRVHGPSGRSGVRDDVAAGVGVRQRAAVGREPARGDLHRRQAPELLPRRALHPRDVPDQGRAQAGAGGGDADRGRRDQRPDTSTQHGQADPRQHAAGRSSSCSTASASASSRAARAPTSRSGCAWSS